MGTEAGRGAIDRGVTAVGLPALPWKDTGGLRHARGGDVAPVLAFFLLTGVSVLVLRRRDPDRPRPFATPLYPLVPLIFIGVSGYMLYASVAYARALSLMGLVPLVLGVPLFLVRGAKKGREEGQRAGGSGERAEGRSVGASFTCRLLLQDSLNRSVNKCLLICCKSFAGLVVAIRVHICIFLWSRILLSNRATWTWGISCGDLGFRPDPRDHHRKIRAVTTRLLIRATEIETCDQSPCPKPVFEKRRKMPEMGAV